MDVPLLIATNNGHCDAVLLLLEAGANTNVMDQNGYYAIHLASIKGYVTIVERLLDYGMHINTCVEYVVSDDDWSDSVSDWNVEGDTPLHLAVQHGHVELAKILIQRGALINALNDSNRTPLHLAVQEESENMMRLLLEHGADIYKSVQSRSSVLKYIITNDTTDSRRMLEIILQYRGSKRDEYTIFIRAIKYSNIDICKYLIDRKNVDINATNKDGNSLLHIAAMHRSKCDVLRLLIDNGANKNVKNKQGLTPLDIYSDIDHIVRTLLI